MKFDGVQKITMQDGDRIPDHPRQMMNPIANLVRDLRPARTDLIGRQCQRQRPTHSAGRSIPGKLSHTLGIDGRKQFRDPSLLLDDRPPTRLRGMRGQRGLDLQPIDGRSHLGEIRPPSVKNPNRFGQ